MGENEALMRRWFQDVWKPGGETTVDELLAPDVTGVLEGREIHGPQQFQEARRGLLDAFPDLTVEIEDVVEQHDKVAVRWNARGTHQGAGLGFPATFRAASFRGITWVEIRDGRIVRGWDSWNLGALLQSLLAPPGVS